MGKHTGKKLIIVADVLLGICLAGMAIGAIIVTIGIFRAIIDGQAEDVLSAGGKISLVSLILYLSNLLLRGYGEMVKNSEKLCDIASSIEGRLQKSCDDGKTSDMICCDVCKTPQAKTNKFCCNCGMPLEQLQR